MSYVYYLLFNKNSYFKEKYVYIYTPNGKHLIRFTAKYMLWLIYANKPLQQKCYRKYYKHFTHSKVILESSPEFTEILRKSKGLKVIPIHRKNA